MAQPLEGLQILEVGGGIASAAAGKTFSDYGASVIARLPHGATVEVSEEPRTADSGIAWYGVRVNGVFGWLPGDDLSRDITAAPAAAPAAPAPPAEPPAAPAPQGTSPGGTAGPPSAPPRKGKAKKRGPENRPLPKSIVADA